MPDDFDLPLGGLENGLKGAGALVFAVKKNSPNQPLGACGILHRRVGIADCHSAAEESASAVLDGFHFPKLAEKIRPDEPAVSDVLFGKTKLFEVTKAGQFRGGWCRPEIHVHGVFGIRGDTAGEPSVQGRDAVRGEFHLSLLLDLLDRSRP